MQKAKSQKVIRKLGNVCFGIFGTAKKSPRGSEKQKQAFFMVSVGHGPKITNYNFVPDPVHEGREISFSRRKSRKTIANRNI